MNYSDTNFAGWPLPDDRVDGRDKVTGKARYAAEHIIPGMTYGVLVGSTIAKGSIRQLDTKAAAAAPGVLGVFSHLNTIRVPGFEPVDKKADPKGQNWKA